MCIKFLCPNERLWDKFPWLFSVVFFKLCLCVDIKNHRVRCLLLCVRNQHIICAWTSTSIETTRDRYVCSPDGFEFCKYWYRHLFMFVRFCLYLLSQRTQLLEHYKFICHLLHFATIFGHQRVYFTTTYPAKSIDIVGSPLIIYLKCINFRILFPIRELLNT
jgi:hypothetical protein